jgi:repressor LexA
MVTSSSASPPITPRQSEILEFIRQALTESGAPPTRDEIARAFGFRSLNAAEQHLQALQKKGLIELVAGTSRGIRLKETVMSLKEAAADFGLPLIGKVAAGSPILAQQNVLKHPAIDPLMFRPRADYLLEVRGMSMRDAGILDGDLLAVQKAKEAKNGQIVVARLGDEVTVKRFKRGRHGIELIPENPDFETIVVSPEETQFEIEGLAVGLIRNNMMM